MFAGALHDRIMLGGHFPDRVRCDTWSVDSIPLLNIGKRSTQEELRRFSGVLAQYRGTRNQNPGSATCAEAWSNSTRLTLRSASFRSHLAKMGLHADRWPRRLHLVHLVLPTVHLLRRSRSQHRAGAPAPIAAPRWQGGLRGTYQPRLARRKLHSSARVVVHDVLRALLRAHRLRAAGVCGVCIASGALLAPVEHL